MNIKNYDTFYMLFSQGIPGNIKYVMIIGKGYVSAFDPSSIDKIERFLADISFKGDVIFDMILSTVSKKNRYIRCIFDGTFLDLINASVVKNYSYEEDSRVFFLNHYDKVDTILLNNDMKFKLKNGITL